jgi:hypothetical protein
MQSNQFDQVCATDRGVFCTAAPICAALAFSLKRAFLAQAGIHLCSPPFYLAALLSPTDTRPVDCREAYRRVDHGWSDAWAQEFRASMQQQRKTITSLRCV